MRKSIPAVVSLIFLATTLSSGIAFAGDHPSYPVNPELYQALKWRNIGPFLGGRTTAVAGYAGQPYTFYLGSSGGGVWKTTDAGTTWKNISDGFFNVGTIGALAVAPSDPNVIYAGTGEASVRGVTTSHGDGIYKSTDAGKTWIHIGLEKTRHIGAIKVDPRNPDIVFVAAQGTPWKPSQERGVYRSMDGGKTWKRVLFVNETTGAHDLSIDPANPRIVYAAMWDHDRRPWNIRSGGPGSGLWKSTDGGDTWHQLSDGLPKLMGNIGVSVSPANPNRVYAMIEAQKGGVFRSDDAGKTWKRVNGNDGMRDRGWYYTRIFADPIDENTVYVLSNSFVKSTDGGVTFTELHNAHGDNHGLWINPRNTKIMIESNDGGAAVTLDGGHTWSSQVNQPTGQFYRVFVDNMFPYNVYGAQQDRGTVRLPERTLGKGIGIQDWKDVGGGESATISMDADKPELIYASDILGSLYEYNNRTGTIRNIEPYPYFAGFRPAKDLKYRFNWNAPLLVSQHDPNVIYYGAQVVLKSTDRGNTWTVISPDLTRHDIKEEGTTGGPISIEGAGGEFYNTIFYIAESPRDADTLWVGSDDGLVHITRDGGKHWTDITPRGMPEGQVNAIEVSPHDPGKAYIAVTRYKFGDFRPMIYRTEDYGKSWKVIVNGIPKDVFARVVREDPNRPGLLYAGTEDGMYISFNDGRNWQPFQLNLPRVPITDLKIRDNDLVASTQGRAFWILDDLTPLQQLDEKVAKADMYLFKPRRAYRLDHRGWAPEPGENPPDGATFHYEFAKAPDIKASPVVLEILDSEGRVIRRFTSEPVKPPPPNLVKGVLKLPPAPAVPAKAGMNAYTWNLRVAPYTAVSDTIRYVSQVPYRVAPGTYKVKLFYGEKSLTQSFTVVNDPRHVSHSAAQWSEQQELLASLRDLVNDIHRSTNQMRSVAAQAGQLTRLTSANPQASKIAAAGHALIDRIAHWEEQVPQAPLPNGVQDYVSVPSRLLSVRVLHLISIVDQDPPVTEAAKKEARELTAQWAKIRSDMDSIKRTELEAFNATLNNAGIAHDILPPGTNSTPPRVPLGASD